MFLSDWISEARLSDAEAARGLGIGGINPGRTLARIIKGERPADADMIHRIELFTNGKVGADDMHAARLAWLRANRPDKVFSLPVQQAAAE